MTQPNPVVVFDTTHHALWAEDVARELALGVETVPAPQAAGAGCDLALEVLPEDLDALITAMRERSIAHRLFTPGAA